jgi:hypothetical protein
MERSLPLWLVIALSIAAAALIGWFDQHAEEVQGTVLLLLIVAAALAFAAPRYAWIAVLILGISPQGAAVVSHLLGIPPRFPMSPSYGGLLALIPAGLGAGIGAVVRHAVSPRPRAPMQR